MRPLFAFLCLVLSINAHAQDVSVLPSSSAKMTDQPNKFRAEVCLVDSFVGKPLADKNVTVGVMHVYPNDSGDGRNYFFEQVQETGRDKTFTATTNQIGCLVISDILDFGSFESLPKTNSRGHTIGKHDPIAERIYGIISDDMKTLIVAHIVFNQGIKTGRVQIEAFKN